MNRVSIFFYNDEATQQYHFFDRERFSQWKLARLVMVSVVTFVAATQVCEHPASAQCEGLRFVDENFAVGNRPLSVTTGDFNGDGVTDLATANNFSADVSVLLGLGDGTFAPQQLSLIHI